MKNVNALNHGYYRLTQDVTPKQRKNKKDKITFTAGRYFRVSSYKPIPGVNRLDTVEAERMAITLDINSDYAEEIAPYLVPVAEMNMLLTLIDAEHHCGLGGVLYELLSSGKITKADVQQATATYKAGTYEEHEERVNKVKELL